MGRDDAELMQRWQRGDAHAFEALVRRWQTPMARFFARLCGRDDVVPDLCQELFLRVYQAAPRYRENGSFAPWLYRIALNVARDAGRRQRSTLPLPGEEPACASLAADAQCETRESVEFVRRAVAELPEPLRLALILRHYQGLSFEEIARLTTTPASTLKSRFAAALEQLRRRLHTLE
jgi:RNA polymerase sigma-70 factor (ECF subfamily)